MKKAKWIVSFLPLLITTFAVQFMPDTVPTHYDASGNIDGRGSKYLYFLMPVIILLTNLMLMAVSRSQLKKAAASGDEKKTAEAVKNAKVFDIAELCTAAGLCLLQCFLLYMAWNASKAGADKFSGDSSTITVIINSLMFIVLGNVLPKTKLNGAIGLRVSYSMYNDNTWRRSNRFGGYALMLAGVLSIITTAFVRKWGAVFFMLGYLTIAVIIVIVYAKKVYEEEITRSDEQTQ